MKANGARALRLFGLMTIQKVARGRNLDRVRPWGRDAQHSAVEQFRAPEGAEASLALCFGLHVPRKGVHLPSDLAALFVVALGHVRQVTA